VTDTTVPVLDAGALALGSGRTDAAGAFTILAPARAPYIVLVRRLGYDSFTSPEIVLGVRVRHARAPRIPRDLFAREWGRDGVMKRRAGGAVSRVQRGARGIAPRRRRLRTAPHVDARRVGAAATQDGRPARDAAAAGIDVTRTRRRDTTVG
jgi:hypothetical protein